MEDFIGDILHQIAERLGDASDALDVDALIDQSSEALHSIVDKISESGVEIDENNREFFLNQIAEAIGGAPETIADNLSALAEGGGLAMPDNLDFTEVNIQDGGNGSDISFGSAGCWDECIASVKEAGKRMTCGYYC